MVSERLKKNLRTLIDVNTPIIYIHDFDFARVDELIYETVGFDNIVEWNPVTGCTDFRTKEQKGVKTGLADFLETKYTDERNVKAMRYLVLKDIQDYVDEKEVKAVLQLMAQRQLYDRSFNMIAFIVSAVNHLPVELKKYVSYLDVGYPNDEEIGELIEEHIEINEYEISDREKFNTEDKPELIVSLKGMSKFEIDRVLDLAMSNNGNLSTKDTEMILRQKAEMVKKSRLLELVNSRYSLDDIGGLDNLKDYLDSKAKVFKDLYNAHKFGVSVPKGLFLVGMPGCGKSLCAKATAKKFDVLLLKMDIGSMMGKYVGQSEENLRSALKIAEAAAPCVLWIDEIEKAFSGVGGDHDANLTRMFGYLLTWMQEKTSSVYILATANKVKGLPPEFLRKGRFDEIFCVNLPTKDERKKIFEIHLGKLEKKEVKCKDLDCEKLAALTNGYNGADIEAIVNESVEYCFLNDQSPLTMNILQDYIKKTPSISQSCKEQIEGMRKIFQDNCFRDATTGKMTNAPKK